MRLNVVASIDGRVAVPSKNGTAIFKTIAAEDISEKKLC